MRQGPGRAQVRVADRKSLGFGQKAIHKETLDRHTKFTKFRKRWGKSLHLRNY